MSHLLAVASALPGPPREQGRISDVVVPLVAGDDAGATRLLRRLHAGSGVRTRHLALAPQDYAGVRDFGHANDLYLRIGTDLAAQAAADALAHAGVTAEDVDLVLFTSVTGIGAPSVDASLVRRLGMRSDVRRTPSFGWGCGGGAAGLARVHDHLVGHPHDTALLVCLELCSLTLQHGDTDPASLVASGLFGDGAAAAVLVGDAHPAAARAQGPEVVAARSRLYPGTEGDLGWQVGATGFRIVLSAGLPDVIRAELAADVEGLLAAHGLKVGDVTRWVVHAGGPRILDAVSDSLGLPDDALAASRASLAAVGNLSSASVLDVLDRTLRSGAPGGSPGVLLAFGPGVSAEVVLLRWSATEG
ncbi:chalcone and stilbene synthase domain protein [Cellulomonas flavigena DSM 20109]|uniref:Chalcone and stilbene synthase domain protein n=1 Tax=Cellulomonas flavigena (strain ATCC 482 / DSM 20109 / BCRC 11376 / JCM 18109 / NBRC 3775 / NCIMB 8073 / NRS 134) TaxID=446466 RepID=D5ULM2_CELFN|nr:3-oxoacyl-[acyl-carrier-protein] synthase III C-terminal domain-containing protein [Cellulomonas flavigena]ADG74064.1 chalcone and stilbene synthase domain protein [Cellulomonas flavigena DSM 20109]